MAAEYVFLTGKAKWFKHQKPNKFGNYSHDIYLDAPSLLKIEELKKTRGDIDGIKNSIKEDDDGKFVSLSRPQNKQIRGKIVGFAPPEILGRDGLPLHDMLVGNGSDITTKCEYYTYRKPFGDGRGSAIRWLSTRVDNLVPFVTQRDFMPDSAEERLIRGLDEQPLQPEF